MIQTARLMLMPLTPDHATALFADLSDPALYTFQPDKPCPNIAALRARFTRICNGPQDGSPERWLNWTAFAGETPIGTIQMTAMDHTPSLLAYMILTPHQNQGYATESCRAIIADTFTTTQTPAIDALIDTRNAASTALVERLDFARIATLPNADHFKGSASDEYHYRLPRHKGPRP
ncbi:MAG: ribosomal-protein-alanine N-acetyltransferase [Paracoccaceae bacterium]|jgi:ribosomal-protein-alanine N-acetyltransferase